MVVLFFIITAWIWIYFILWYTVYKCTVPPLTWLCLNELYTVNKDGLDSICHCYLHILCSQKLPNLFVHMPGCTGYPPCFKVCSTKNASTWSTALREPIMCNANSGLFQIDFLGHNTTEQFCIVKTRSFFRCSPETMIACQESLSGRCTLDLFPEMSLVRWVR